MINLPPFGQPAPGPLVISAISHHLPWHVGIVAEVDMATFHKSWGDHFRGFEEVFWLKRPVKQLCLLLSIPVIASVQDMST